MCQISFKSGEDGVGERVADWNSEDRSSPSRFDSSFYSVSLAQFLSKRILFSSPFIGSHRI